jgi:uncharacterized protein (TIGR02217 family)
MSNAIYPTLAGRGWSILKKPKWSTKVQTAVSGKELRAAFFSYPLYTITNAEYQTLIGFFNARQGSFDNFLFTDDSDNAVTAQSFGTGNGTTTGFQLVRTLGGNTEPTMNINTITGIYVAGVLKTLTTDYTIDALGYVTFVVAPAAGAALTWTGSYYYRCRFLLDENEFEEFMNQLWLLRKLELYGSLGVKV